MAQTEIDQLAEAVVKKMKADHHAVWLDPETHASQHEFLKILMEERAERAARRTFPIAFPTACFAGFVIGTTSGAGAEANHVVTAVSTTTLSFTNNSATAQPFYFFAVGN